MNDRQRKFVEYFVQCGNAAESAKRAYLQGEGDKRKEWGISTVILNKRSNPCPLCAPFVGKVFIDDVWSGALASYDPIRNTFSVIERMLTTDNLAELQKGFACADDDISTYLHELIHWQDAQKYRAKYGDITDFAKYIQYLNKKFFPKLEKLEANGYNIDEISPYAFRMLREVVPRYDEVYTELRVKQLLE